MSFSYGDQTLQPVYITIENLNAKTRQSQKGPGILLLVSISIIHERLEDTNNKDKNLKAKIYHMALKTMLQCTYSNISFVELKKGNNNDFAALFEYKNGIKQVYADGYKRRCYLILTSFIIDYKVQVLITDIKTNM